MIGEWGLLARQHQMRQFVEHCEDTPTNGVFDVDGYGGKRCLGHGKPPGLISVHILDLEDDSSEEGGA